MTLPVFYHPSIPAVGKDLQLPEESARHIVQVLRMQAGAELMLADGKGKAARCSIVLAEKKKCTVHIVSIDEKAPADPKLYIAVGFTKNSGRNEWMLEKLTELGVAAIIPLSLARTEREKFKPERWNNILVSAMMQSQQWWLPELHEATTLKQLFEKVPAAQRLIAHCSEEAARTPIGKALNAHKESLILIGPEGDFTGEEVALCKAAGCVELSLGTTRLRTETAAITAAAFFKMLHDEVV